MSITWCWSWNCNTLATWCKELTHLKRPWCWERLRAGGEGDDRGWDGWMASSTRWTWVWVDSGSWWWTGRPGVLRFIGLQKARHDWATELNWTHEHTLCGQNWNTVTYYSLPPLPNIGEGRDRRWGLELGTESLALVLLWSLHASLGKW